VRRVKALVALLLGTVLLSGCEFDVYQLPLPGGADLGDDPIEVTVEFADVLDLVPKSAVKVADVTVGQVSDIELEGDIAVVTVQLRKDTELPDNAVATIRQTSLLGEKFVSLAAPAAGASDEPLGDGDEIPIEDTGRNPEVEEVLGALSLVLNGGGVAQLKTIANELNLALEGREDSARSVLTQIDSLVSQLDDRKGDIVNAIESINRLSLGVREQRDSIEQALEELPSALDSLERQREDLVAMLEGLQQLGDVGVRVINQTEDVTLESLQQLEPVLTQIAAAGDSFVDSFSSFLTFPFVDDVVGRDPQVARNLHMGDYVNLSIELDLDLGALQLPGLPCVELEALQGIPLVDLADLCSGLQQSLQDCLNNPGPNCADLPGNVINAVCDSVQLPVLCDILTGGGNGGGGGGDDLIGDLLDELGLGGLLGGGGGGGGLLGQVGLNRPAVGAPADARLPRLRGDHDQALVDLLAGPLASTDGGDRR